MRAYRLSVEADGDVDAILRFTIERWGLAQAERYGAQLHSAFERLAEAPETGRRIDHIRTGYRRLEHASHSIYYRPTPEGVMIIRVLHRRMMPQDRIWSMIPKSGIRLSEKIMPKQNDRA